MLYRTIKPILPIRSIKIRRNVVIRWARVIRRLPMRRSKPGLATEHPPSLSTMSRQSIFPIGHLPIDLRIGTRPRAVLDLGEALGVRVDLRHLDIAELAHLVPPLPPR